MNRANSRRSPKRNSAIAAQAGILGEHLVRDWLLQQHWQILHQRWRCRWGELDLIAHQGQNTLAFVEVKVRGQGNWDRDGLLAMTTQKQIKLCKAAQLFLSEHPDHANNFCRFDVALVSWMPKLDRTAISPSPEDIVLGQPVPYESCSLTLEQYIAGAFDAFTV
ncbi:MAG: YraN family protein [Synechococcales cyanobacterium T60_A2020_003]|nr:YraN family protein [Synechococcales cyanobacterium T60_A2020_003]